MPAFAHEVGHLRHTVPLSFPIPDFATLSTKNLQEPSFCGKASCLMCFIPPIHALCGSWKQVSPTGGTPHETSGGKLRGPVKGPSLPLRQSSAIRGPEARAGIHGARHLTDFRNHEFHGLHELKIAPMPQTRTDVDISPRNLIRVIRVIRG